MDLEKLKAELIASREARQAPAVVEAEEEPPEIALDEIKALIEQATESVGEISGDTPTAALVGAFMLGYLAGRAG